MTHPPDSDPDDTVPAGFVSRLILTAAPFVAVVVIGLLLRWLVE